MTRSVKQRLAALALGSHQPNLNRRTAAFLFDRGVSWQPSEPSKRRHLLALLKARGHETFVEAGTYVGDTVAFLRPHVRKIVSVELDDRLYAYAAARFAGDPSVEIRHGDALAEIPRALRESADPPLVYVDAHFSGPGTAVGTDIEPAPTLLSLLGDAAPDGTTLVVDDLRLFGASPTYPRLETLTATAREAFPTAAIRVGLDSLVIEA